MKYGGHMVTAEYLRGPETLQRRELVWGLLREAPGPDYGHQRSVTDLAVALQQHVRKARLGQVCVAPIDVILDANKSLVVQPDLIFVSTDRLDIISDRIWGAPDLVVEVLSPGTRRYDSHDKLEWFRVYGVRECWLVDSGPREITVHVLNGATPQTHTYGARDRLRSTVLPRLKVRVGDVLPI